MSATPENSSLVSGEYLVFGSKLALHEYHTPWVHSCASGFRVNSSSRNSRPGAERTSAAPVHSCSMQRRASPCAGLGRGGSRTAPTRELDDRAAEELSKVVVLDAAAEVAPNFSSAGADPPLGSEQALKASATNHGTESPADENAAETSKSPEQSQHVIENKAPAAEGVSE